MAAYAEGLNILKHANVGKRVARGRCGDDAASRPAALPVRLRSGGHRGGLAARQRGRLVAARSHRVRARRRPDARRASPGSVSDSGEGRWTLTAAIDEAVPAHVLAAALFERFASRGEAEFQDRVLSAMRFEFGGHVEKPAPTDVR